MLGITKINFTFTKFKRKSLFLLYRLIYDYSDNVNKIKCKKLLKAKILTNKNYKAVYLKTNILRAETAALYGVSAIQTILLESENWMLK